MLCRCMVPSADYAMPYCGQDHSAGKHVVASKKRWRGGAQLQHRQAPYLPQQAPQGPEQVLQHIVGNDATFCDYIGQPMLHAHVLGLVMAVKHANSTAFNTEHSTL